MPILEMCASLIWSSTFLRCVLGEGGVRGRGEREG